jgi:hypothetical protein
MWISVQAELPLTVDGVTLLLQLNSRLTTPTWFTLLLQDYYQSTMDYLEYNQPQHFSTSSHNNRLIQ